MEADDGGTVSPRAPSADTARRFFDLTGDLLAVLDAESRIVEVNATFAQRVERATGSIEGELLSDVIVPTDPITFAAKNALLNTTKPRIDFDVTARIAGHTTTLSASLHLDADSGNRYFVARDISEQMRLSAQLDSRGNKDELSGLGNRHGFEDALELELKMGEGVAVIRVTMNGVDRVVDEHGEAVANELIQAAVSRMRRNLRDSDIMARFARGEFAILLVGSEVSESAERLGAQLTSSLRRAFGVKGTRIELISAIGAASGNATTHNAQKLLDEAAAAVDEAQRIGSTNAVVFGQSGLAPVADSGRTADDVRAALTRLDDYEVMVQGIFTADGKGAMGVEVILTKQRSAMRRLTDDAGAESLDAITVETATETLDVIGPWLAAHRTRRLCVNVAAVQLGSPELFAGLAAAAKAHLLEPRQIVCELSEATLDEGGVATERMTEAISTHGLQVSLDGFGIESAGLARLRSLDAGYVKLDPALVDSLFTSDFHSALIRSAVDVASTMGISVIANGVSNQQQLEAIRKMGCGFVQGSGVHPSEPLLSFADRLGLS